MGLERQLSEALQHGVVMMPGRPPTRLAVKDFELVNVSSPDMPAEHRGGVFHAFDPLHAKQHVTGRLIPEKRFDDQGIDPWVDRDAAATIEHPMRVPTYSMHRIHYQGKDYWWMPRLHTPDHVPLHVLTYLDEDSVLSFARSGLTFLDALHEHGLVHVDPTLSNFIGIPIDAAGEPMDPELFSYKKKPSEWLDVCEERGPIRIETPYAVDLETSVRRGSVLEHVKTSYIDDTLERHLLKAHPSTDIFIFDETVMRLANRSTGSGRRVWRELREDQRRYLKNPKRHDILSVEEQLEILKRPETKRHRWRWASNLAAGVLLLTGLAGTKVAVDAHRWSQTETVAVQNLLSADTITREHVYDLAAALARKIEWRVKTGQHPTWYPFMEGPLEDYVDDPTVVLPMVPIKYSRDGTVSTIGATHRNTGSLTELLYMASVIPDIDGAVREAARANAYAQALWILRADIETAIDDPRNYTNVYPLMLAYEDTKDAIFLEAMIKGGDIAKRRLVECEHGIFIPYLPVLQNGFPCYANTQDIQSVEDLLAASKASQILQQEDGYLLTATQILNDFEKLVDADTLGSIARYTEGKITGFWSPIANAVAARTFSMASQCTNNARWRDRSKKLLQPLLDGRISLFHTADDWINTYADAVAVETGARLGLSLAELRGDIMALAEHIPQPHQSFGLPLDDVTYEQHTLLEETCTSIATSDFEVWCRIGYVPAEATLMRGLLELSHRTTNVRGKQND